MIHWVSDNEQAGESARPFSAPGPRSLNGNCCSELYCFGLLDLHVSALSFLLQNRLRTTHELSFHLSLEAAKACLHGGPLPSEALEYRERQAVSEAPCIVRKTRDIAPPSRPSHRER